MELFIKTKLKDGRTVRTDIKKDNVYAICSECGEPVKVNLGDLFSKDNADPFKTDLVCPYCGEDDYDESDFEGIVTLALALCKVGCGKQVFALYDKFDIAEIEELLPGEYETFLNSLLNIAADCVR